MSNVSAIHVTVVVPPVVCHHLDPHTGIPFMPHMAAHFAGALHVAGFEVQVIDCFGLQPHKRTIVGEFMLMGEDEDFVASNINPETKVVYIYCRTMAEYVAICHLSVAIKRARPYLKICLFENIQSVTSFSLREIARNFCEFGVDAFVFGEPENRAAVLTDALATEADLADIAGIGFAREGDVVMTPDIALQEDLDALPLPLWERWPLTGYWIAGFAHAPDTQYKFLPLLTSRGCPYRCTFCISPSLNPKWRARSATHVVDEMEHFWRTLGVAEFHISDLDPTVNDKRTRAICEEIIHRKLPIIWKLAQGTKIETIKSEETLELMHRSGCTFVAFSPESGSSRMLKIMQKPFDHEHAVRMVRKMSSLGIHTQACFIAGVPGEEESDRRESISYVRRLMQAGVDEIAVYVFAPIPGAKLGSALTGYSSFSECTFSPTWREDYKIVQSYRTRMYLTYFSGLFARPWKLAARIKGLLTGVHKTKMEMSLFKQIKLLIIRYAPWLLPQLDSREELRCAMGRKIIRGHETGRVTN